MTETLTIMILRHAQAGSQAVNDFERPLTPKGLSDMTVLSEQLTNMNLRQPDVVLCSAARRTKETLSAALPDFGNKVEFSEALYSAATGDMYEMIKNTEDKNKSLLMIGHNPYIHSLALFLAKDDNNSAYSRLLSGYNPGTLTILKSQVTSWQSLSPSEATIEKILAPSF